MKKDWYRESQLPDYFCTFATFVGIGLNNNRATSDQIVQKILSQLIIFSINFKLAHCWFTGGC